MSAPQTEIHLQAQPLTDPTQYSTDEPAIINISDYLSAETIKLVLNAGEKSKERGSNVVSLYDLFFLLATEPQIQASAKANNLDLMQLKAKLALERNKQRYPVATKGKVIITTDAKEVILRAFSFADKRSSNVIMPVDLWESILNHQAIIQLLFPDKTKTPAEQKDILASAQHSPLINAASEIISKNTENLTAQVKSQANRPIIDREKEINQILRIITRQENRHCLLIGEPGVGKTSVILGLAYTLTQNNQLPDFLKPFQVLKLDFGSFTAGSEYPGSNIQEFIAELSASGKYILFIEGVRYSNVTQEQFLFNNFLALALKLPNLILIMGCDNSFYITSLIKEPLINENFEVMRLEEPKEDVLKAIIAKEAGEIAVAQGVTIREELFDPLITLSRRYLAAAAFPQKAISLLEEAATMTKLAGGQVVDEESVRKILSEKTGIPLTSINISDREKLLNLENELNQVVIGQQHAVREVVEAIKRSRAGLKDQKKPIGSFLFLGPTGVGKTELAKQLTAIYYDDEKAFVRLDMSEFSEQHTNQRLIGSPPGYTGYEEGGQFTNPILQKPYSLILLDEIEKAHPKIFDIFLQVLDEGRLTDSRGKLADFRNSILIFTSNIAADIIFKDLSSADSGFRSNPKVFYERQILPELLKNFRPEFINRFDEIIPFNPLGLNELVAIAKLKVKRIAANLREKGITLITPDTELAKLVQYAYDPRFGARPIERMIKDKIENPIAQQLIAGGIRENTTINWLYQ